MFSIGDFAALGRVSVRTLRHYDAIGLLKPAETDPASGYRFYQADQLRRLNRIIALKDLGLRPSRWRPARADDDAIDVRDLPGLESAATIVHRGPMDEALRSMQILARWIDDNGYRPVGYAREVCLQFDPDNPANWVHQLQLEVAR